MNPAMDNRLKQAIISEDPDLVVDLRHLNKGRPNDTFEQFFNLLNTKVDDIVAADERRHSIERLDAFSFSFYDTLATLVLIYLQLLKLHS
jgi:hypothetical protein